MKRLVVLLFFTVAATFAPASHAGPAPSDAVLRETMDGFLNGIERGDHGIGSVSISKGGRERYARSFGQKNLPGAVYDQDTKYQIASVTKMVTSILAFKLMEDGRLSLDDRLADFFPDMPSAQSITINHLLAHTSGLGNFAIKDGAVWIVDAVSQQEILDEIRRQGATFAPGEQVAYSNSAYYLLRLILEQRYGRPYHEVVAEQIAEPLGLTHFVSALGKPSNVFKSYRYTEARQWVEIKDVAYTNVIGVGDIASTTADLNTLIVGLFQTKLLRKRTLALMEPVLGAGWGRGLAEFRFGSHRFLGHGGDVLGSHSRVIFNPDDGVAIAYSTNGENIPTNDVLESIVKIVYGDESVYPEARTPGP